MGEPTIPGGAIDLGAMIAHVREVLARMAPSAGDGDLTDVAAAGPVQLPPGMDRDTFEARLRAEGVQTNREVLDRLFARHDRDGDAALTDAEFEAAFADAAGPSSAPSPATGAASAAPTRAAASPAAGRPLTLAEYPPANPVGAHGLPNYLKDASDVDHVLGLLSKTGATNTTLLVPFPEPATLRDLDRQFLERAKAQGVTVQLRLGFDMKPGNDAIPPASLKAYVEQVRAVTGVAPYVALGNEPNLAHEWADGRKPDPEAFGRWWARYADAVTQGGGHPGLPGLAAGAFDAPDGHAREEFRFYEQMLRTIDREAPRTLDAAWTGAHPYHMYGDAGHPDYVEDVTWQLGRFNALNEAVLGRSLPVIVTESGYVDGANSRRFDPNSDAQARDVARHKASLADRPAWLLVGTADWTISNRHGGEQWKGIYGPNGEPSAYARTLEADRGRWKDLRDDRR